MSEGYQPSPEEMGLNKKESTHEKRSLSEVDPRESQAILDRLEVRGSLFQGESLTKEDLLREDLGPKYKIDIEGRSIWFSSSAYELGSGRDAVVAYVEKNDRFVPRPYYRSNSQGVWRYLPAYRESDGHIRWYSKGYGEESITLPIEAQQALAELTQDRSEVKTPQNPEFIFAGMSNNTEYSSSFRDEVSYQPARLDGNFYATGSKKTPPEQVQFLDQSQSPDFSQPVAQWEQQTSIYGQIDIEAYSSKNGQFKYMFCRDRLGRAWIGGIEDSSPVTSTGLRERWIKGGDLTTPAYEYDMPGADQTGGYGDRKLSHGQYSDMYEKYLSKIPVIQEYQRLKKEAPSQRTQSIETARNLEDLYRFLDSQGGLQGSDHYFSSSELKKVIEAVQKNNMSIRLVTRTGGLRQKVAEILGKDLQ